ncbi:secreted protein [Melampsora americana]|nr:secreted protein [Melampsora americana]
MHIGVIFLALFFVTISHVRCAPNLDDDLEAVKVICIPFRKVGNNKQILLVTMTSSEEAAAKGPMFVRGHVKVGEESEISSAAVRETKEETGYDSVPKHAGKSFDIKHPKKDYDITMHPYTVEVSANAIASNGKDVAGRSFEWVSPSTVARRLRRPEMRQAWDQLKYHFL